MFRTKPLYLSAFFLIAVALCSPLAHAQSTPTNCTASQAAAVQCFVANAVSTDITKPRHGMTLAQFEAYGVSVSSIVRSDHTYLVIVGISSAVADAMPATNADGSANSSAQGSAIGAIVSAAVADHLANTSTGVTIQDLQWFSIDVATAMNDNNEYLALLTPGVAFRMIDSYVVSSTSNGVVNWSEANSGISSAVQNFVKSGLMKVPPGVSQADLTAFAESVAKAIYTYKVSTKRTTL
jgi:hypothetical protein